MLTHRKIDERLLAMVSLCVDKIDSNPALLSRVSENVIRIPNPRIRAQWDQLLRLPWPELKQQLLAATEAGDQLRQNTPFGGLLSNRERFQFFQMTAAKSAENPRRP